ncbi:hypothetical protein BDV24DRAFT_174827 [Aspergillus arachidicola]|uniref:Short-chain dehydrogenase n=1 Tax=Aspergillus arachidicola TaxID=656916 RepID=A0A5N6Y7F3_9EURO|nr:hypothetical protein BDV24DRAFT_174827 [Aspergillus arachidicola]
MKGIQFEPDQDIPDLTGKVILVTGANTRIFLAARSEAKAQEAITELKKSLPRFNPSILFLQRNLSSFQSIKAVVKTFHASSDRLDLLINNAGIMATPPGRTEDGVVFLSSSLHSSAPKEGYFLDNRMKTPMPDISTWTLYGQSKLANIHYCRALAQRNPEIKFVSIHPGLAKTNLGTEFMSGSNFVVSAALKFAMRFTTVDVREGAFNSLWVATNPAAESRVLYYPVGVTGKDSELAKDEKLCEQLWEYTEKELRQYLE